jgi:hypothetical protein
MRGFQLHQRQSGMQPPSINTAVLALRFLFTVTLDRPDLACRLTVVRQPRRLPSARRRALRRRPELSPPMPLSVPGSLAPGGALARSAGDRILGGGSV